MWLGELGMEGLNFKGRFKIPQAPSSPLPWVSDSKHVLFAHQSMPDMVTNSGYGKSLLALYTRSLGPPGMLIK